MAVEGWHFSFFDRTLQPYPQAWFVKSMFESEPVVRIGIQDDSDVIEWNDVQVGKANISSHTGTGRQAVLRTSWSTPTPRRSS